MEVFMPVAQTLDYYLLAGITALAGVIAYLYRELSKERIEHRTTGTPNPGEPEDPTAQSFGVRQRLKPKKFGF
jgi:hypothetical protein